MRLVDAQIVERLANIEIGFPGRNDAEARTRAVDHDPVEPVYASEGERGVKLVLMKPIFLIERLVRPADIEAVRRHFEVIWRRYLHPFRTDVDGGRTVDGLGNRLERDPAAGVAGHRPAVQAEI